MQSGDETTVDGAAELGPHPPLSVARGNCSLAHSPRLGGTAVGHLVCVSSHTPTETGHTPTETGHIPTELVELPAYNYIHHIVLTLLRLTPHSCTLRLAPHSCTLRLALLPKR